MKKSWIKLAAASVWLAAAVAAAHGQAGAAAGGAGVVGESAQSRVLQQAASWGEELSKQEQFRSWKDAELAVSALGPGTHSWIALFSRQHETVGYMIIHATDDGGFRLGEYGLGAYAPFSERSLDLSLAALELAKSRTHTEKLYATPLMSVWKLASGSRVYYADAVSGEQLPMEPGDWEAAVQSENEKAGHGLKEPDARLEAAYSIPSYDPYATMPWLTSKPMAGGTKLASNVKSAAAGGKEIRYTTQLFDRKIRYVWSVVGYHEWNGQELYIALDADEDSTDRRYIPFEELKRSGGFYR